MKNSFVKNPFVRHFILESVAKIDCLMYRQARQ